MRGLEHLWRVLPCEAYVLHLHPNCSQNVRGDSRLRNTARDSKADLTSITVKYHAYLRKMTRYNPTRGGKIISPRFDVGWCLIFYRSFPFPCSLQNLLQDRPWHDSPQDRSRCRRYGETQGFRGRPTTIRQNQESGCSPSFESPEIEARPKVLHSWQIEP
jgi:hypothetical protein